jgi:serine phosphatase RsbU (regulator of sigma subunit)
MTSDQITTLGPNDHLWIGGTGTEQIICISLQASEADFARALQQFGARRARQPAAPLARSSSSMAEELAMAGRIQSNILPERVPVLPGWDIAARLIPARETSGDFYDFIPVTERNWGIVIADVADKGMGAALFMTLTSTLFRGFAARHPTLPGLTLDTVNERILSDTRGSMFVTAFFGVLEPHTGRLRYANAGHPPPLLIKSQKGKPVDRLVRTGMALGVEADEHWTQKMVSIAPGDVLVLYTDGVIEAMNPQGRQFDFTRLQDVIVRQASRPSKTILDAILSEVYRFTAGSGDRAAHSFADDTALIVLKRKE